MLGPGGGGWIQSMAAHPTDPKTLLLGCDVGGYFVSRNEGVSWEIRNTGLHDYFIESIAVQRDDPNVIFLGTQSGVHKSTDGGATWRWLRNGWPEPLKYRRSAPVSIVAIDPRNPKVVYAGIGRPRHFNEGQGRIYKSEDGGERWFIVNGESAFSSDAVITDLVIHPRESNTLFACTQHGLYRSGDSGKTWDLKVKGLPHPHTRRLAICAARPNRMYLTLWANPSEAPWQGGVYRTDNGGESWRPINSGLRTLLAKPGQNSNMASNYDCIAVHPENPDIVYAGGTTWVTAILYRTIDGENWQPITHRETPNPFDAGWLNFWGPSVKCLAISPADPKVLWFGTSGHVFRTADGGDHWEPCHGKSNEQGTHPNNGLAVTCLHHVNIHPGDRDWLYFGFYDIGLLQSRDRGRTWRRSMKGVPREFSNSCFCVAFEPEEPRVLWAGFGHWGTNKGAVGFSTDGGSSWKMIGQESSGLPNARVRSLLIDPQSKAGARRLYATSDGHGVFTGEDNGARWKAANAGLPNGNIRGLIQHPRSPASLYCVFGGNNSGPGHIYRTDDGAQSWRHVDTGGGFGDVKDFAISASSPERLCLAVRQGWVGTKPDKKLMPGGLFLSDDGGVTWQKVFDDHFVQCVAIDPEDANRIYIGTNDHPYHDIAIGKGVFTSADGGKTWLSLNHDSLTVKQITAIHLDAKKPGRLYVGTGGNSGFVMEQ